jgi:lipid II:glycine glycyltransferase (peptidoglycan interpeptide bridge formation enzyme)
MSSIFQTPEWEKFKLETGYQKSIWVEGVLVLVKSLPFGGTMMYSPRVSRSQVEGIRNEAFLEQIAKISAENKAIFYRMEFDFPKEPNTYHLIPNTFSKSFEEMQPEHTLILDLTQSEEEILTQMKQKGRYNIKIAERSGIQVKSSKSVDNFYRLYETMSHRQKISYRGKNYFQKLVDILGEKDYILVFDAYSPDSSESLASAIVVFCGERATYLFGGSSDQNRNLMAPYKLHWEIIKYAKDKGFKEYDFFGIAPEGAENHPWSGVTRFKEQFGGNREDILGSYDLVFNKLKYRAFRIAEQVRRKSY